MEESLRDVAGGRPTRCPMEDKDVEYAPVFGGWQCPSCGYYTKDPDR